MINWQRVNLVLPPDLLKNLNQNHHLILLSLGWHKVPVGQADGSQAVLCHRLDHSLDKSAKRKINKL